MKCSQCQTDMVEGIAQVRGTVMGFLFLGISYQNLYFDRNNISSLILGSRENRRSFLCPKCSGVFIPSRSTQPRFETDPDTGIVTEYEIEEEK